ATGAVFQSASSAGDAGNVAVTRMSYWGRLEPSGRVAPRDAPGRESGRARGDDRHLRDRDSAADQVVAAEPARPAPAAGRGHGIWRRALGGAAVGVERGGAAATVPRVAAARLRRGRIDAGAHAGCRRDAATSTTVLTPSRSGSTASA